MKIICIKLSSGEEIIGKIAPKSSILTEGQTELDLNADITVEHVRVIGIHQDPRSGQIGIGLTPWSLGNQDGKVTIKAAHITATYDPVKQIEDSFIQDTTPIKLTSKMPGLKM